MNRFFCSLLALCLLTPLYAHVLDAATRVRHVLSAQHQRLRAPQVAPDTLYVPLLIRLEDDLGIPYIESLGGRVWSRRGDIVACAVPEDALPLLDAAVDIDATESVLALPQLDEALPYAGIDAAATLPGLPQVLTGAGTVTGIVDTGIDTRHPAWLDADGRSRIRRLTVYDDTLGVRHVYDDAPAIFAAVTDNVAQGHGSHTTGIVAGAPAGTPYRGVAPEADIVFSGSRLYSATIAAGMEDVVQYAHSVGKPAVINLSLGSQLGPHDGTSLFNRYADMVADDAIVVMSAGNWGSSVSTMRGIVDGADGRAWLGTGITDGDSGGMALHEKYVDIWGTAGHTLQLQLMLFDADERRMYPLGQRIGLGTPFTELTITSDPSLAPADTLIWHNHLLQRCGIEGSVSIATEVSRLNGRPRIALLFNCINTVQRRDGRGARYRFLMQIYGDGGEQRVDMYTNAGVRGNETAEYPYGDTDMSISDLACGHRTISVGMLDTRSTYPLLDGAYADTGRQTGVIHPASSYGTLADGRTLPHVSAPGNVVVSAQSSALVAHHGGHPVPASAEVTGPDGQRYWWFAQGGTSMSAPLVSGLVALWLQVRPELTVEEVREALMETGAAMPDAADPRYGSGGALDAAAATRYILSLPPAALDVPGAEDDTPTYYNLMGQRLERPMPGTMVICRRGNAVSKVLIP